MRHRLNTALLAAACALGGAALALTWSPSPADAVGGLTLEERVFLTGTPVQASGDCGNRNPTVVPEGRRWFIYGFRWIMENSNGINAVRIGGRIPLYGGATYRNSELIMLPKPLVLRAGEQVKAVGMLNDEPVDHFNHRCQFDVLHAYEF